MRLRRVIDWRRMPSNMETICHRSQSIWMRKFTTSEYDRPAKHTPFYTSSAMTFWLFSAFVSFSLLCPQHRRCHQTRTKCCYGLSMDLLENVATELGFEFHLYVVRDQLFGAKKPRTVHDHLANGKQSVHQQSAAPPPPSLPPTSHSTDYKSRSTDGRHEINHGDTGNREYTLNTPQFFFCSLSGCTRSRSHWNKAGSQIYSGEMNGVGGRQIHKRFIFRAWHIDKSNKYT